MAGFSAEADPAGFPLTSAGSTLCVARRSHLGSRNSLFSRAGYVRFSVRTPAHPAQLELRAVYPEPVKHARGKPIINFNG
jgi:hypothetical protein